MKDLIVIIGTILLGCLLFGWIAGDGDSLKSAAGDLSLIHIWTKEKGTAYVRVRQKSHCHWHGGF